uniref:Uncharacterized protein n=1 Tax=Anguilla anguilla TaxID=7936 RepID=A0A0E9UUB9_ANGAN
MIGVSWTLIELLRFSNTVENRLLKSSPAKKDYYTFTKIDSF